MPAERYRDEILQEIPEVDAVVGIGANGDIDKIVDEVLDGKQTNVFPDKKELPLCGERVLTTPDYWAYLKIAEGCSNCCTYCAIPSIRTFRSRDEESIVEEAKTLANGGVKELVLIAQDVSSYGIDIYGEYRLAHLLDLLCEIDGIEWIRLLYCYPDKITDELIDTMASQPKVLHYIDLPLQHADDKILKAMNRHSTAEETREVIRKLRERMPDIAIRTTFIVGFPARATTSLRRSPSSSTRRSSSASDALNIPRRRVLPPRRWRIRSTTMSNPAAPRSSCRISMR